MRHVRHLPETIEAGKVWAPSRTGQRRIRELILCSDPELATNRRQFLAELKAPTPFLLCRGSDNQRGNVMKKIEIAAIPELGTSVGMHGSVKQQEVGGLACLVIVIAALIAL
jgi:hypothetical protein